MKLLQGIWTAARQQLRGFDVPRGFNSLWASLRTDAALIGRV